MTYRAGEILKDRYLIKEKIGTGSMGEVYRAEHIALHKQVAIKVMHLHIAGQSESLARFRREAAVLARLDNPHICQVTDFDTTEQGDLYLVMEFLTGETLRSRLEREHTIEVHSVFHIMRDLLSALETIHQNQIVHRDIKPDNIMLLKQDDRDDYVKLIDFGIVRSDKVSINGSVNLTQMGRVYGTPQYLSPEQVVGERVDHRADLYSCGCTLYEMLEGVPPFEAKNYALLLNQHLTLDPPHLSGSFPHAKELDAIIQKLLQKHAEDRFQTAREIRDAINSIESSNNTSSSLNIAIKKERQNKPEVDPNDVTKPNFLNRDNRAERKEEKQPGSGNLPKVVINKPQAQIMTFTGDSKRKASAKSGEERKLDPPDAEQSQSAGDSDSPKQPAKEPSRAVSIIKGIVIVLIIAALVSLLWYQVKLHNTLKDPTPPASADNTNQAQTPDQDAVPVKKTPEKQFVITKEMLTEYAKDECRFDDDAELAKDEEIKKAVGFCLTADYEKAYAIFEKYKNKYADSTRFNLMRTIATFATGKFKLGIDALTRITQTEPEAMCIPVVRDINYALIEQDDVFQLSMDVAKSLVDPGNSTRAVAWLLLAHACGEQRYQHVFERDLAMYDAIDIRDRDPAGEWLYQAVYMWRQDVPCNELEKKVYTYMVDYMEKRCDTNNGDKVGSPTCTRCYPVFQQKRAALDAK